MMDGMDTTQTLREAAEALVRSGHGTVLLRGAVASRTWAASVRSRVVQDLAGKRAVWAACGLDVAVVDAAVNDRGHVAEPSARSAAPAAVPVGTTSPPAASSPAGAPFPEHLFSAPQMEPAAPPVAESPAPRPQPVKVRQLSAETVLAQPAGEPLRFDGTLDGLRGVPVTDLAVAAELRGKVGQRMQAAGIESVFDLLTRVPLRYLDRTKLLTIDQVQPGMQQVALVTRVVKTSTFGQPRRRKGGGHTPGNAKIIVGEGKRTISCTFFNQGWQAKRFNPGDLVLVLGDITVWQGGHGAVVQMQAPLIEPYDPDTAAPMLPIYPQSDKHQVTTWQVGRACVEALRRIDQMDDPLPEVLRTELGMPGRLAAMRAVHVPDAETPAKTGRDRLAFDELLRLQLALGVRRAAQRSQPAVTHRPTGKLADAHLSALAFPLTAAQQRAIDQIRADLSAPRPMNRLLQGDVGSGKTVVMEQAALAVVESGHQAALMAPTEVLAMQHFRGLVDELAPLGVVVGLLASRQGSKARRDTLVAMADGTVNIVVGTQSLLSDEAKFASLGLVMVDEQHRFGVAQRAQMAGKAAGGATPDLLVATATPIPRTAALTVFGDLDVTVLDEMPPGRTPIATVAVDDAPLDDQGDVTWQQVRAQITAGRQAYVVCPLVVESEKAQAAAAVETAQALTDGALSGLRVGVATGKQSADERAEVMGAFTAGHLDVLVATTVIEVGVNVPNAAVIVILDAPRFGLAQLHQLRGRVGRGQHPGSCVLVGSSGGDAQARVEAMCQSTDGFVLSQRDLEIRGPGALAGTEQAGRSGNLVVANLLRDGDLMLKARDAAREILTADPKLGRRPTLRHEVEAALGEDAKWLLYG